MRIPGKTFVAAFGLSLTLLSAMMVVAMTAGAPFAVSTAAIDGFHTSIDSLEGDNFTINPALGGVDECQALLFNEADNLQIEGFTVYRKASVPGGNVSVEMKIPRGANFSMDQVQAKLMALESEQAELQGARISENYTPTMTMGRHEEFNIEADHVDLTNASTRLYAISSGSMQLPLALPDFDIDINERAPDGMPLTTCPDEIEHPNRTIGDRMDVGDEEIAGLITDGSGEPVRGATVRVPLEGEDLRTTTDGKGRFSIDVEGSALPPQVTLIAGGTGYTNASAVVSPGEAVSATMPVKTEERVTITADLHHLGDGLYDGEINSNFQAAVEGERLSETFTLDDRQASAGRATLVYSIRGAQLDNTVRVNGEVIADAGSAPDDGTASEQRVTVNPDLLRAGTNELTVTAAAHNVNEDDFEITNIRIVLEEFGPPPASR